MKVLVATDGSEFSKAAVEKCCKMFEGSANTQIRILSVAMPVSASAVPFELAHEYIQAMESAAMAQAKEAVADAEEQVRSRFPDMAGNLTTKAAVGLPKQVIVEEAEGWGADLVVLGSHGYGFWKRAYLGSVSDAVLHHAPCSVLIVRPPKLLNP